MPELLSAAVCAGIGRGGELQTLRGEDLGPLRLAPWTLTGVPGPPLDDPFLGPSPGYPRAASNSLSCHRRSTTQHLRSRAGSSIAVAVGLGDVAMLHDGDQTWQLDFSHQQTSRLAHIDVPVVLVPLETIALITVGVRHRYMAVVHHCSSGACTSIIKFSARTQRHVVGASGLWVRFTCWVPDKHMVTTRTRKAFMAPRQVHALAAIVEPEVHLLCMSATQGLPAPQAHRCRDDFAAVTQLTPRNRATQMRCLAS